MAGDEVEAAMRCRAKQRRKPESCLVELDSVVDLAGQLSKLALQ